MDANSKLKQNILYNVVYQMLILIIPIITLPYLTRVFTVEQLGINSYTLSIMQIFILLSSFGMKNYGSREIASAISSTERNITFWSIWFIQIIWTLISLFLFLIFNHFFVKQYSEILLIQSLLIIINSLEISWFFIGIEELKKVVMRNTVIKISMTILIFCMIKESSDFLQYIFLNIITTFLGNIILVISTKNYINKPTININLILFHMKKSVIFLIPQFSNLIYTTLDRTLLGNLANIEAVNFYDQSQKIVRLAIGVITSVGIAILPRMTVYVKKNDWLNFEQVFSTILQAILILSNYIVIVIVCISPSFVIWFFGNSYAPVISLMQITSIIGIFIPLSTLLWNTLLIPMNRDSIAVKSAVYAALISIISNIYYIPRFGAFGAVFSLCITELFCFLYRFIKANKYYNLKKYIHSFIMYSLEGFVTIIVVLFITNPLAPTVLTSLIQTSLATVIYFLLLYIFNRRILLNLLCNLRESIFKSNN